MVRAHLVDEGDHDQYRRLLLSGDVAVASSELARVEVPRALLAAQRARRVGTDELATLLEGFEQATSELIDVIPLDAGPTLRRAVELVRQYPLGTLDAIHLAVADREGRALAGEEDLVFVTADGIQATAARALGFETAP